MMQLFHPRILYWGFSDEFLTMPSKVVDLHNLSKPEAATAHLHRRMITSKTEAIRLPEGVLDGAT
jgi:hypothetical protein